MYTNSPWHLSPREDRNLFQGKKENGAGDESRTRDLNLGKVALYQLSYSRIRLEARIGILHTRQGLSRQIFGKIFTRYSSLKHPAKKTLFSQCILP